MYEGEGIGLFRTEFKYMGRGDLPSEDELVNALLEIPADMEAIVRIADFGGDKMPHRIREALGLSGASESGMMSLRGERLYLHSPEMAELQAIQIRAILRAAEERPKLKMMFPMVAGLHTLRQIRRIIAATREDLVAKRISHAERIPVGIMVELPSTVRIIDQLMPHIDFASIGTNDLIQYTLAVDREAASVARYYDPFHPAVLRQIDDVVRAGAKARKVVSVCGDMASDPMAVLVMMGMGIRTFSAIPGSIPNVKYMVLSVEMADSKRLTRKILRTIGDIGEAESYRDAVRRMIGDHFGANIVGMVG